MSLSINAKNVKKYFKDVKAIDGLNLDVQPGEFIALLGPNGAGKSTLIEMLEGVQKQDSGEIFIDGYNWEQNANHLRSITGISFQETRFMDKVTVHETLKLFASFYKSDISMVRETMNLVGLADKQKSYIEDLSGGQRQKLALAISLINKPKILFLDEPTTGLDPGARREIWSILEKMHADGTTIILTTHYMEEAEFLCERILIMFEGKIIAEGSLEELLGRYSVSQTIELELGKRPAQNWLKGISGIKDQHWKKEEKKMLIHSPEVPRVLPEIMKKLEQQKIEFKGIQCRSMTLDDLFILLTGTYLHE
ncbi:MAG: ABC transporter ATP-binding protein [Leptospirales bacterium]